MTADREQLERAIAAQESLRGVVPDDVLELAVGARIEVVASPKPVRLARIHSEQDRFTDRLVRKFDLPVSGWRGPAT